MRSLAIEREFGSGGREIGIQVARMAKIPYYDGELIKKAAEAQGVSTGMLEEFDEKYSGSFLHDFAAYMNYSQGAVNTVYDLFSVLQRTILKLAQESPAVFIGRCSTEILKGSSDTLRVFIYSSDLEKRLERIMREEGLSQSEARNLMEKKDRQRKNYFKYWTKKEWADRKNYDLELNTSALKTDECAELLWSIVKKDKRGV